MRKKTNNLIFPFLVMGVFLIFASSCKKDDDDNGNGNGNNTGIPVLTTTAVTDITQTTANSGGNITSDGGATVTARGVCWSTGQTPTISDNKTTDGTGAGNFTSSISGLSASTTYYVRAYATNSYGTGYGSAMSFTAQQGGSAGSFTDSRDGNVYQTVTIGNQVWMAENLKYLPSVVGPVTGSETTPYYYVYGYNGTSVSAAKATSNYSTYGVLYNWPAAMAGATSSTTNPSGVQGVCPPGWHLPSDAEWAQMENYLADNGYNYDGTIGGGGAKIAKSLASSSGWSSSSNTGAVGNTDYPTYRNKSGFTALPGGSRNNYYGTFSDVGNYGYCWSATEGTTYGAWFRGMYYNFSYVSRDYYYKELGFSVRCVRD